ncbi:MAG: hypothetical protein WC764_02935 [Candidatus Paceibacterota bacterium]
MKYAWLILVIIVALFAFGFWVASKSGSRLAPDPINNIAVIG